MKLWDEMKIADGVDVLKLTMDRPGGPNMMHATLIRDNDTAILVDTGLPGQLPEIREVMVKAGVPFINIFSTAFVILSLKLKNFIIFV